MPMRLAAIFFCRCPKKTPRGDKKKAMTKSQQALQPQAKRPQNRSRLNIQRKRSQGWRCEAIDLQVLAVNRVSLVPLIFHKVHAFRDLFRQRCSKQYMIKPACQANLSTAPNNVPNQHIFSHYVRSWVRKNTPQTRRNTPKYCQNTPTGGYQENVFFPVFFFRILKLS